MEKAIDGSLDLILGGGRSYYESKNNEEILSNAKAAGVTFANSWDTSKKEYTIKAQADYIEPGETLLVGYTLPFDCRGYKKFAEIRELVFFS